MNCTNRRVLHAIQFSIHAPSHVNTGSLWRSTVLSLSALAKAFDADKHPMDPRVLPNRMLQIPGNKGKVQPTDCWGRQ